MGLNVRDRRGSTAQPLTVSSATSLNVRRAEIQYRAAAATALRLSALIDLYIHPLYILVIKILSSISILPHPSILYPLWGPLITLSKYIHMRSCFEEFIKTNLMVQSKFHLDFWFVSYNIFCYIK
jgi:hypothetical protein